MKRNEIILLIIFFCLSMLGVFRHEIWLDEAHHWLLARDSQTLGELWSNMRYDGHPILWNILLFIITRFTRDVIWMQLLHVCISVASVAVFLFCSPFRLREKALFISGYFILYEYTLISRNYALMMFFLFVAIVCYSRNKYLLLGLTLALLANTHLFGLAIASFFAMMAGFEFFTEKKGGITRQITLGSVVFIAGAVISILQIIPPSDSGFFATHAQSPPLERIFRIGTFLSRTFIPIPDVTGYHFWNSNLLLSISKSLSVILSLVLFFTPLLLFRNRLSLLFFFYSTAIFISLFLYFSDLHRVRYFGAVYLVLISCIWLKRSVASSYILPVLKNLTFKKDYSQQIFIILLVLQTIAGAGSYVIDIAKPFSESKSAVSFMLRDPETKEYLTIECGAAAISAYLEKKVYYLTTHSYGSFCLFNRDEKFIDVDLEQIKKDAIDFVTKNDRPAFLITNRPLTLSEPDALHIRLAGRFEQGILKYENYYIYKVSAEGL